MVIVGRLVVVPERRGSIDDCFVGSLRAVSSEKGICFCFGPAHPP